MAGRYLLGVACLLPLVTGCASLPTSGPTTGQVLKGSESGESTLTYQVIDITAQSLPSVAAQVTDDAGRMGNLAASPLPPRVDTIRKGDVLEIRIFEVGIGLFEPVAQAVSSAGGTPEASGQTITSRVREDGTIDIPYVGSVEAAGTYPEQLAAAIRTRLQRFSQSPEVLVTISESVENAVYVSGAVENPGRYSLSEARERVLDAIALAGGATSDITDVILRISRGDRIETARLSDVDLDSLANLVLLPGDRIQLLNQPMTYTVFGASEKVSQVPFQTRRLTLAEAIARAAGPSDARANPRGVFLFRLTPAESPEEPATPVAYRINMMRPESYFLAQMVEMQDKDVLLFANAPANLSSKLISMINQLLSPAITAATISNATR
ncbi:polysaccharide biosynthesis/export family protein [Novosphingobium aquimarinum]|uniref:polysaccharide biosynthesis/export family protein n=1 Tax=Novosphingobium aquimarinum TaxID=2682494 RepID=UPI0018DD38A9|nr:polysaccharide biosynthesis/export family protein [Novosphingobium aquimarinum]